jgi:hypothetical protein|tara:strand:+ start:163 stop:531 length:369 start_codon:yes stop_codon:yes gene_type:complete
MVTSAHLDWFRLKCPYDPGSKAFRIAKAKLDGATYEVLDELHSEFDLYNDGSTRVQHIRWDDEWYATCGVPSEQVNMKGIQQHGNKFRVQIRIDGELRKWTFETLNEAMVKRDAVFDKLYAE